MAQVDKDGFLSLLEKKEVPGPYPVYLFYGERYLVQTMVSRLLQLLLPAAADQVNLQVVDGSNADYQLILESLNTFSLFAGPKVVVVKDSRVFYSKADFETLLVRAREAHATGDFDAAASNLAEACNYAGIGLEDIIGGAWRRLPATLKDKLLGAEPEEQGHPWLEQAARHAVEQHIEVRSRSDDAAVVENGLRQGLPPNHALILTTDKVDRRRSLYGLIDQQGLVVNLEVGSGSGRQAQAEKEAVLRGLAQEVVAEAGKKIGPAALAELIQRTGFNLWALKNQLEALIAYAGSRDEITFDQVVELSHHLREEPLYQLNHAVSSAQLHKALQSLHRLLAQGFYPLQIIASLANEFRRLLWARHLLEQELSGRFDRSLTFGRFQADVYPRLKKNIAAYPSLKHLHPYALHRTLQQAATARPQHLIAALVLLHRADLTLKSTGADAIAVLEALLLRLAANESAGSKLPPSG